jgi:hypothetical protein
MPNAKTQKKKVTKAKPSEPKSKILKSGNKRANEIKQALKSKDGMLKDTAGNMSNEKKLLKDMEEELRPLTNLLDEAASRLSAELDKHEPKSVRRKRTTITKK